MHKQISEIEFENSQLMCGLKKDIEILKMKQSSIKEIGRIMRKKNRRTQQKQNSEKFGAGEYKER